MTNVICLWTASYALTIIIRPTQSRVIRSDRRSNTKIDYCVLCSIVFRINSMWHTAHSFHFFYLMTYKYIRPITRCDGRNPNLGRKNNNTLPQVLIVCIVKHVQKVDTIWVVYVFCQKTTGLTTHEPENYARTNVGRTITNSSTGVWHHLLLIHVAEIQILNVVSSWSLSRLENET